MLPCIYDNGVRNTDKLSLGGGIACCGRVFCALVEPFVEALKWIIQVVSLPDADIIFHKVSLQNKGVISIQISNEFNLQNQRVSHKVMLEWVKVGVLKHREELVAEGSDDCPKIVVLTTCLFVIPKEQFFID